MASTRKLARLGIEEGIVNKLRIRGILSVKDFLCLTKAELLELLDLPVARVESIAQIVSHAACPSFQRVFEIYQGRAQSHNFLPTDLAPLDVVLRGGIAAGSITELVGPAGMGKSQLCKLLAVNATLPPPRGSGGSVIYMDTEKAYSSRRVFEIAKTRFPEVFSETANSLRCADS
eukprot:scaffold6702_cov390-Prasinococcus_capsulatus_cf.AAC.6